VIRKRQRQAIESLGFTVFERYLHPGDDPVLYPEWQTVIEKNGKTVAVIVTHGCHTDDPSLYNRYQLRRKGHPTEVFKLKRQAIAAWARSLL